MGGNGGGGGGGDGVTVVGRAEIDMRAPFRSVKEAVVLFGERERPMLAGDVHGSGLHPLGLIMNRAATTPPAIWPRVKQQQVAGAVAAATRHVPLPEMAELEEAKKELEKERSEKQKMAGCILSLQEELSNAMRELRKLKAHDDDDDGGEAAAKVIDLQVEDLKFVEIDDNKPQSPSTVTATGSASPGEFQKRRYVTFAEPPTSSAYDRAPPQAPLPDVVIELRHRHNHNAPSPPQFREVRFLRQMSAGHGMMKAAAADQEGRKKKKSLIPVVGALFMRKKKGSSSCSCHDDDSTLNPRISF